MATYGKETTGSKKKPNWTVKITLINEGGTQCMPMHGEFVKLDIPLLGHSITALAV
jgi:hypothetical protein